MNTSTITERDKKLLYVLGLIVIVALFYILAIRPLNNKISILEDKIDTAQVDHDTIQMKIFQYEMLEEFQENAIKLDEELSSRYYEKMVSADVDKMITGKSLGYGLKVNNLSIQTGRERFVLTPYTHSQNWEKYQEYLADSEDYDSSSSSKTDSETEDTTVDLDAIASINDDYGMYYAADTASADVYATRVTLDVYGNREKAQRLLDEITKDKSMRVTSFEWTSLTGIPLQYVDGQLVSYEPDNAGRLIVNFELYMYDGKEFDDFMTQDIEIEDLEESEEADM